eukprot:CAMPEP_0204369450 /NCGR_PEP_ID=MMETSP0469-20131031/44977_1 /ASSEMBLY_ACC=CAM_ASM_000384 /TAXON_ID=2969 /ORGANISM="Oxyrrhis marina" /LENGTH=60 /DNA_ID=CAMNT_0051359183 /DNA_START=56 /DNA_END=234 /DNA_ORIENTATION=+
MTPTGTSLKTVSPTGVTPGWECPVNGVPALAFPTRAGAQAGPPAERAWAGAAPPAPAVGR